MSISKFEEIRAERLAKVQKIRDLGINPYPASVDRSITNAKVFADFETLEGREVTVAGRLMSKREHGDLLFGHIQDTTGKIQLYVRRDVLAETSQDNQTLGFDHLALIDVGDFIGAHGEVTKTKTGEISILVKELRILTKSLRPLPDKWEGLSDIETRFRRRYLDLAMNPEIKARFERKSAFWRASRDFLHAQGFIEVETPVLEHTTGGADARPFVTHHNDLGEDLYLRISSELSQKRLIGGGFEKIFTLGPNFRNEGTSDEHLQEYTQLEWYMAFADYRENMKLVREFFTYVAEEVYGTTKFSTRGHEFDLANSDWPEIDYAGIISERYDIDIFKSTEAEIIKSLANIGIVLTGAINRNRLIDNLWKSIRKTISGPAFLINEPKFMSPLAKSRPDQPELTERFHLILGGSELGNGYSELNDPLEQLARFEDQQVAREAGDEEAQMLDEDFVEMLEYGMPPTSGWGHSERVFWFFEDIPSREGVFFPLMRSENKD